MRNSTAKRSRRKSGQPAKPHPDFPLFAHRNGQWAKKLKGEFVYFGKWATDLDGQKALAAWLEQKDNLLAGRPTQKRTSGGLTVRELANHFLTFKRGALDSEEITARTFGEYYSTCEKVIAHFGANTAVAEIKPAEFGQLRNALSSKRGLVALTSDITRVRMLFRFAFDARLVEKPVEYGPFFKRPTKKALRIARKKAGAKMFEADEARMILAALEGKPVAVEDAEVKLDPDPLLRALVLLAFNAAFGQGDLAALPLSALDLDGGWVTFPRPKTGIDRRAKLWPETVDALRQYLAMRPKPRSNQDAELVFLQPNGKRLLRPSTSEDPLSWSSRTDAIGRWFAKLARALRLNGHRGFYAIRHTFHTEAEKSHDLPAVRHVMGHVDDSISDMYRERLDDDRLEHVAAVVHAWLWPAD